MAVKFPNGVDLQSQRIINVADPSSANDAANKLYVDNFVRGLAFKDSVKAATTTNGALATAYENGDTLDSVSLVTGDRILLKDQTTGTENGIYTVNASGAPTRATDLQTGDNARAVAVTVEQGTTNDDKIFHCTSDPAVVGTDALTFTALGGGSAYVAGDGLTESPALQFNVNPGSGLEVVSDAVRIAAAAAGNGLTGGAGSALAVGAGTGISVAADAVAVDTGTVARWVDNGATHSAGTTVTVTHNFGKKGYISEWIIDSTGEKVFPDVVHNTNTAVATFGVSQSANTIRGTVVG